MIDQVTTQLIAAGPVGAFCVYLIWRQQRDDKAAAAERSERLALDQARVEADKALAASLATLATTVQGWPR